MIDMEEVYSVLVLHICMLLCDYYSSAAGRSSCPMIILVFSDFTWIHYLPVSTLHALPKVKKKLVI